MIVPSSLALKRACNIMLASSLTPATTFELTISTKKTKVMRQSVSGKSYLEPNISETEKRLIADDKFTNLDSTLSRIFVIDDEVHTRPAKEVVITTLLYDCASKMVYPSC